jgi:hypothetical protein
MRASFILEATKPCGTKYKYRLEFSLGLLFLGWLLGTFGLSDLKSPSGRPFFFVLGTHTEPFMHFLKRSFWEHSMPLQFDH